ncbi:hypothetical protein [Streptomyces sp. NPDC059994]|uniref:hypothetical protein n=1 Tax=Streptomyces sp. NPDC059994 TaxID=3347029 RepID=UPI00368F8E67
MDDQLIRNAIRNIITDHNTHRSGYGYSDGEIDKMIEAVRVSGDSDSRYDVVINTRDGNGGHDSQEYGMTYWTYDKARTAAQWRVNRVPYAVAGIIRLIGPSGTTFNVGAVWPETEGA